MTVAAEIIGQDLRREVIRRRIVSALMLFFLFLPLEGVLRKWVLNEIEQPLVFIRDPILLYVYFQYAEWTSGILKSWLFYWIVAGILFVFFAWFQVMSNGGPIVIYLLGLRGYVLYIPLAFVMAEAMRAEDLRRWLKLMLTLSIPIGMLAVGQFFSPVESAINKGLTDDVEGRFIVIEGVVRTYGPFTFTQAQSTFAALALAAFLIAWVKRVEFHFSMILLTIAGFWVFAMGAVSGARTYFGSAILVILAYMAAGLVSRNIERGLLRALGGGLIVGAFLLVFIFAFPSSFEAMSERQASAIEAEGSTVDRGLSFFTSTFDVIDDTPFLGYGMGIATNAGQTILSGKQTYAFAEYEWPRIVQELGPIYGLLFIVFRIWLFLWLVGRSLRTNLQTGDPSSLIMFGFVGYLVLVGQITAQNQLLSFSWFSVGLVLALSRQVPNSP